MKKILWLDDEIEHLGGFVEKLQAMDMDVRVCKTFETGMELLEDWSPDTFIIDLNLQNSDHTGVEFLRVTTREFPDATHVALSSYLYRKSYLTGIAEINHPILQLDKVLPPPKSPEFNSEFLDLINEFSQKGEVSKPAIADAARDPFKVTFSEWRALNVLQRDELDEAAEKLLGKKLDDVFQGNTVWALYCGSSIRPKATADSFADIWKDEDIIRFGRKQGYAPYTFLGPATIAEIWSDDCHPNDFHHDDGFAGYPTVRFSIGDNADLDSHFDTGSAASYFDYDQYRELGFVQAISIWSTLTLLPTMKKIKVRKEQRELLLKSQQEGDDACVVEVNATFVRDWAKFPYSKICGTQCSRFTSDGIQKFCKFRGSLLGRDILNNDVQVVLDSKNGRTLIRGV